MTDATSDAVGAPLPQLGSDKPAPKPTDPVEIASQTTALNRAANADDEADELPESEAARDFYLLFAKILLIVYSAPIVFFILATATSYSFSVQSVWVKIAEAVTGVYGAGLRETIGNVMMPLITAFAVTRNTKDKISQPTKQLFWFLFSLFVASITCRVLIDAFKGNIQEFGKSYIEAFSTSAAAYIKEALICLVLLVGVSQAKGGRV